MLPKDDNEIMCRVGPGTPMGTTLRRFWTPFMLKSELPMPDGAPVRVRLLGEDLVAFRDSKGRVGLFEQGCAHRGTSLFFGRNEDEGLRCIYHGWKYDVTGQCVEMPSEPPESNFREKARVTAYPCVEKGGFIWTYMGPKELMPPLPHFEWMDLPEEWVLRAKIQYEANFVQSIEGEIDTVHTAFLHSRLNAREQAASATTLGGKYIPFNRWARFHVKPADNGILIGAKRPTSDGQAYWRISRWFMPYYSMTPREPGTDLRGGMWVPMDDENTWVLLLKWHPDRPYDPASDTELIRCQPESLLPGTWMPATNKRNDYGIDREVQRTQLFSGIPNISGRAQDAAAVESMGPIYDRTKEHLGTTDSAIIAMRRYLLKTVKALQQGQEPSAANNPEGYFLRSGSALIPDDIFFDDDPEVRKQIYIQPEQVVQPIIAS